MHKESEDLSDLDNSDSLRSSSQVTWIVWYCSLPQNAYFLEVPEDFIEDDFNMTGLNTIVPYYNEALDMILDLDADSDDEQADSGSAGYNAGGGSSSFTKFMQHPAYSTKQPHQHQQQQQQQHAAEQEARRAQVDQQKIEGSAQMLYGLIHARYLLTKSALTMMGERFEMLYFGRCPRSGCGGCGVVPCGLSDSPGVDTIKMYCPRCNDVYHPKRALYQSLDGAYFGKTFPAFLFLTSPQLIPQVYSYSGSGAQGVDRRNPEQQTLQQARDRPLTSDYENSEDDNDDMSESEYEEVGDEDQYLDPLPDYWIYVPKIFGFRVSELSKSGPRMRWLRWRPPLPTSSRPASVRLARPPLGTGQAASASVEDGVLDDEEEEEDEVGDEQ
eukprot:jgi/Hompol1/1924/HPOL_002845-RA